VVGERGSVGKRQLCWRKLPQMPMSNQRTRRPVFFHFFSN
jgi:hypothetical protein